MLEELSCFWWNYSQVTVEDPRTGEAVDFSCQRWFSTSDDDGQIIRELSRDDKDEEKIVDKGNVVRKIIIRLI